MSTNIKSKTYFQINQNLDGKKEKILIIECKSCFYSFDNFFNNEECIICFLKTLFSNRKVKINSVSIELFENFFENRDIKFFLDYFNKLKKIKKSYKAINIIKEKECPFQGIKCKIFTNFDSFFEINDNTFINPILFYDKIRQFFDFLGNKIDNRTDVCEKCIIHIKFSIETILEELNKLEIISKFQKFQKIENTPQNKINFFKYVFFSNYQSDDKQKLSLNLLENLKKKDIIQNYTIGKDNLFLISLYKIDNEIESLYEVNLNFNSLAEKTYFERIANNVINTIEIFKLEKIHSIEELIKMYKEESLRILNDKYEFTKGEGGKLGFYCALKKLNFLKIFPLLIDDYLEEIFLDSPNDEIYIDHQKYGRCRTHIKLSNKEIERIKTLLRLYSGQRLDYENPSLKFVIKNNYFYCRFAIDTAPMHVNDFALDIRKLNKNILTIPDLIKNNTLNPLIAAFLYFVILRRGNLTITGETDSGKTTLMNALDLLTPKEFRKIYVENVEESLNQTKFNKHQLKYQADSLVDPTIQKHSKSNYIKTLLHRSPDIIYLGEILTKEEAEAMFHCLSAGLRGFQTVHSNSIESLMNRFLYHFNINFSCFNDLDLIILMKKDFNHRWVQIVSEIDLLEDKDNFYNRTIFNFLHDSKKWSSLENLYETKTIEKVRKYEDLSKELFDRTLYLYSEIFEFLSKNEKIDNEALVDLFHKISFLSRRSIDLLEKFWDDWKNKRSLKDFM